MAVPSHRRRELVPSAAPPRRATEQQRAVALPLPPGNPLAPRPGEEEFRWLGGRYECDSGSGTPSPELWVHARQYPCSAGSSPSRAQAIAGYRREMLDLVRGLPEAAYELSLRDIVESPFPPPPPPPRAVDANTVQESKKDTDTDEEAKKPSNTKKPHAADATKDADAGGEAMTPSHAKKQSRAKKQSMARTRSRSMERSVSMDTGLLIKLFLPMSVGGKKKVSPKPGAKDAAKKKKKAAKAEKKKKANKKGEEQEVEWWKKREFSEAGSSSRTSSTSSSNSSSSSGNNNGGKAPSRSWSRKRTGCYGFFRRNRSKKGGS